MDALPPCTAAPYVYMVTIRMGDPLVMSLEAQCIITRLILACFPLPAFATHHARKGITGRLWVYYNEVIAILLHNAVPVGGCIHSKHGESHLAADVSHSGPVNTVDVDPHRILLSGVVALRQEHIGEPPTTCAGYDQ